MRTTSTTWDELRASNAGILETKAVINGTEYTLTSAPVINRSAVQDAMTVGNVISASCVLTINTTDTIPKAAKVEILSRYTDGETSSEWLPMGTFYISKRKRDPLNGLIALECYDGLLKSNSAMMEDVPWTDENGEAITDENDNPIMFAAFYPRDMASVTNDIAILLGLTLDERTTIGTGDVYMLPAPAAGATVRDVLSFIGAANAGNWIVTPDNKLRLVPVVSADGADGALSDVVDVTAIIGGLQVGDERTVSGVQYTYGENAIPVLIGDDSGYIMNVTLPYALANALYEAVVGMVYRPYTMTNCRYNPAAEIGDYIRYGDVVTSVLYTETASYGVIMGSTIQAPDFAEVLDEYPYVGASQSALNQAKAYTVQKVEDAVQAIDDSLTQEEIFNRLTGGGEEQGLILYNGKLYVNAEYIQAGYLSANRIRGGTLTLGGENNRFGEIKVISSDGEVRGKWDVNRLSAIHLYADALLQVGSASVGNYYSVIDDNEWRMSFSVDESTSSSLLEITGSYNKETGNILSIYGNMGDGGTKIEFDAWKLSFRSPSGTDLMVIDHRRSWDTFVSIPGRLEVGNGASGTFTTADGKTVTVTNGIITNIA